MNKTMAYLQGIVQLVASYAGFLHVHLSLLLHL